MKRGFFISCGTYSLMTPIPPKPPETDLKLKGLELIVDSYRECSLASANFALRYDDGHVAGVNDYAISYE